MTALADRPTQTGRDPRGRLRLVNRALCELLSRGSDALVGRTLAENFTESSGLLVAIEKAVR